MAYILMRKEAAEEAEAEQEEAQRKFNKNTKVNDNLINNKATKLDDEDKRTISSDDDNLAQAHGLMLNEGDQDMSRKISERDTKITNVTQVDENQNANIRAAFIHIVGDIVQSIGVVIAAVILMIKPEWKIVDPICTFVFAAIVCSTTFAVIKDCMKVLIEGCPEDLDVDELKKVMEEAKGVKAVHDLHVWTLTEGKVCMSAIVESKNLNTEGVLRNVTLAVRKEAGIYHTTIQVMNGNELEASHPAYCDIGQNVH